jgi:NADH-quinone oxidoreductase subunit J
MIYNILYFFIIYSAIMIISVSNPINSVIFLILLFFFTSINFIILGIDFFAFIFFIIYLGAIAVLFLFIVMMLDIPRSETDKFTYLTIGFFILIILFIQFFSCLYYNYNFFHYNKFINMYNNNFLYNIFICYIDEFSHINNIEIIGLILYKYYFIQLILCGLNLLIAMIGSIYLTNYRRGFSTKKQYNQLARNHYIFNFNIY